MSANTLRRTVTIVEPFACSSHAHLVKWLHKILQPSSSILPTSTITIVQNNNVPTSQSLPELNYNPPEIISIILPGKKWHWRMRASSIYLAQQIPLLSLPSSFSSASSVSFISSPTSLSNLSSLLYSGNHPPVTTPMTLFVSSMCNLSELISLRPDLSLSTSCRKIYYMHENQVTYPSNEENTNKDINQNRDFHFGWIQFLSCLVADIIAWNSLYNLESFLTSLPSFLKLIPDKQQYPQQLSSLIQFIRQKSIILPLPIDPTIDSFPEYNNIQEDLPLSTPITLSSPTSSSSPALLPKTQKLRIAWNHRWEYDKNPELFFNTLLQLQQKKLEFEVIILGEKFTEYPPIFDTACQTLKETGHLLHAGYVPDRSTYIKYLSTCDIAISTANHEFFGVSMLEAMSCGVFPLTPCNLAYPEVLAPTPEEKHYYSSTEQVIEQILYNSKDITISSTPSTNSSSTRPQNPIYHPPVRESEHLYTTEKQLRKKLEYFIKNPTVLYQWRKNLFPVLFPNHESLVHYDSNNEEKDIMTKRIKLESSSSETAVVSALVPPSVPIEWKFSTSKLAPLYKKLLL